MHILSQVFVFRTWPVMSYKKGSVVTQSGGRTHGAPYRGYGYVPLRFGGERR